MNEEEKALLSRRFQGTDSRLMETDPEWVEITANFSGKEVIYQATAYLGIGRVHDFLETANAVFKQHGISLPLASQSTTDAASRFDRGLKKQVALFGPDMAKRQTDGPVLRQNINRWLITVSAITTPAPA